VALLISLCVFKSNADLLFAVATIQICADFFYHGLGDGIEILHFGRSGEVSFDDALGLRMTELVLRYRPGS